MAARGKVQAGTTPLAADTLTWRTDPSRFKFNSTAQLKAPKGMLGQDRALEAIELGCEIDHDGFNLFVLGSARSGMEEAVRRLLERRAISRPAPADWVYVYNFDRPDKPNAISLPPGRALAFRDAMAAMVDQMRTVVPAIFESEEYQNRRRSLEEEVKQRQEAAFQELQAKAQQLGTAILHTPSGFAVAPTHEGEVIKPDQFKVMAQADRERIEGSINQIQRELQDVLQEMPKMLAKLREAILELDREYAETAIEQSIVELEKEFGEVGEVGEHLKAVREDLRRNIYVFVASMEQAAQQQVAGQQAVPTDGRRDDPRLRRYMVNVMVARGGRGKVEGAPILREENPSLANMVGRVEHMSQMGALVTDFMLIKPGALHAANGGFLLVDARKLLLQPFAWEALKRALKNSQIKIESASDYMGAFSTQSLEPEPIPLDLKVVLFGDHMLYYLLAANDPEFGEQFKIEAEFDDVLPRERNVITQYAGWIGQLARDSGVRPLDPTGVAAVIDHSARMTADTERLSLKSERIADLMREADYWASKDGEELLSSAHIRNAADGQRRRSDRIRERQMEGIERDIIMVSTSGKEVGQINGLSVLQIGDFAFGKPSRLTASIRMGAGKVVDIEREVELGGPLQSKGVLILSGYISSTYAPGIPLSFGASLVFEQSYGGVDGDSASSTELYAIMSALSEIPIRQSLAVTGSVNQNGEVQAIGGVNEKIEGFFDLCAARRLTGDQGVLIPAANVQHLMLKDEVVEACAAGRFHIYSVATIDQGIEILTGVPAGKRGKDGLFPEGTVNRGVEDRLIALAEARRSFARPAGGNMSGDASDG